MIAFPGSAIDLDRLPDGSWQRRAELEARVLATLAGAVNP
jgi:hypothetical protein